MTDPYRMVLINLITSIILFIGVIIYKFIYPKKNINYFVLLLLISILPLISLLRPGDYESGDFNIHIQRIMSFYDSLKDGNFMPSWASELNSTYGLPVFIFNYPLPYYAVSFFHFIGISFIESMKLYLGLTLYLSGIFMYIFIKKLTDNKLAAFTASIFYFFNPYHLIDVHFRATLGESTIFTLVPLLLFFIISYVKNKKLIYLVSISLVCQLIFLAHPMVAGMFLGISIFFIFSITNIKKDLKYAFLGITALILGMLGSIYSWFSFILFAKDVFPNPPGDGLQFDNLSQVLFSPWRFGLLFQGPKGELAPIFGYTQIFVVVLAIFFLFKNRLPKKVRSKFIFWLLTIFAVIFFMTPYSAIFWKQFPLLLMLNSNRLLLPIALGTSVIAGYLAIVFSNKKWFIYILLFITIAYTILNWGHRRVIPEIDDMVLQKNAWKSVEITPSFMNSKYAPSATFWFPQKPYTHLEIIKGKAQILELERTTTLHTYIIYAQTPITLKENTLYFPGWTLTSNYRRIQIFPGKQGEITAKLDSGFYYTQLRYQDITAYKLIKMISITLFILFLLGVFWQLKRELYPQLLRQHISKKH